MREYFEHAYEGFCNTFFPFVNCMVDIAKIIFVYGTLPIWIIPYALFFRKENEGDDKDD